MIGLAIPILGSLSTKIAIPPTTLDSQENPIDSTYTGQLFGIGDLVASITFIIVAFVIFLLVKTTKKMRH